MKKLMGLLAISVMVIGLSACHTIQGVGKDVSAVGETLERGAHHHSEKR